MSEEQIRRLGERISRLETELNSVRGEFAALQGRAPATTSGSRPAQSPPAPPPRRPTPPAPPRKKRSFADLELSLGGNILGKIGLVALILAAAWFIKLAIDERWINESGRIYLGLVIGFSICGAALYLATRRMRILPGAIFGAGAAIIYIAWFGAFYFYDLLGRGETFAGLALLSMALAYISMRADNQVIYTFSLVGAFLAPILLSSGENSYRFLFAYLTVFNVIFFFISRVRPWRTAPFLVLLANIIVYSGWASAKAEESSFAIPFLYLLALYMILLLRSALAGTRIFVRGEEPAAVGVGPRWDDFVLIILTTILFYFSGLHLFTVFFPRLSPHFALGSAGILLGAYHILNRGPREENRGRMGLKAVLLGMFVLLFFAALTDFTDGRLQAMIWIVFAGVLSFLGAWSRFGGFVIASLPFWVLALFRLYFFNAFDHEGVDTPVFNARFALFLTATALLAGTYIIQRREPLNRFLRGFAYVAMATLIIGTLMENADFTSPRYRNLGYSYVLSGYAIAFLVPGFMKSLTSMRISGMVLLAMVILKLYFYDIWNMSRLVKILAFASLGLGLVLISVIYQKYRDKIFPRNNEP